MTAYNRIPSHYPQSGWATRLVDTGKARAFGETTARAFAMLLLPALVITVPASHRISHVVLMITVMPVGNGALRLVRGFRRNNGVVVAVCQSISHVVLIFAVMLVHGVVTAFHITHLSRFLRDGRDLVDDLVGRV